MKPLRCIIPVLFLLWTAFANADSISFQITNADIFIANNDLGFGDNASITFTGPGGFVLSGIGGPVGFGEGGASTIGWSYLALTIGNTVYDPQVVDLSALDINLFPGSDTTAFVSNSFGGPIHLTAGEGDAFIEFNLKIPVGSYYYDSSSGNAEFVASTTVPEPGTLIFLASGLAGIGMRLTKGRVRLVTASRRKSPSPSVPYSNG